MQQMNADNLSKDLRREVTVLCLVFMIAQLLIGLVSGLIALLTNSFGTAGSGIIPSTFQFDELGLLIYITVYFLMFAIPIAVYFLIRQKEKTTDYFFIGAPKFFITILGSFGILAINYIFTIFSEASDLIFTKIGIASTTDMFSVGDSMLYNILFFFFLAVFPAFMEEFTFRGIIAGRLAKYNSTVAIVVSAMLFAFMHLAIEQIPFAFCAGLLLGYVYLRTKSIWSVVVMHSVNNGFAYLQEYLNYKIGNSLIADKMFMMMFLMAFVLGTIGIVIMISTHKELGKEELDYKRAAGTAMLNPMFLLIFVLTIIVTVLNTGLL